MLMKFVRRCMVQVSISSIKDKLNKQVRITAIQSRVLSKISYGIKKWGSTNATQLHRVQRQQNFAAKVALGNGSRQDHATPFIIKELGWLLINTKYKYEMCLMMYSTIKENIPSYLLTLPTVRDIRPGPTRRQHILYAPKVNTCTRAVVPKLGAMAPWGAI